ncbi:uncharacterized protein LOC143860145 [Tasmannia lanceolata]|uniref:uncharacterized protein LOC143860145 n=1 Tax=Tasmannia lanceolata TaxID=3420 RepID=UPI0040637835
MSRCFPFPPPGYEKKARNDDVDLLTKEKHKEKKLKKKDKEKREGKDKKDKERSTDKQREKKDRKEKHKDKTKDKDKNNNSDKRIEERTESSNGEKLGEISEQAQVLNDSKFTEELHRRIRDDRVAGNHMVETFIATNQRGIEGMGRAVEKVIEKRTDGKEKNKEKDGDDRRGGEHKERDERRGTGNEICQNLIDTDQRRIAGPGMGRPMEKDAVKRVEGKERNKEKRGEDKKGDKHRDRDREEKRSRGKDKDRDRGKEKEKEKVKEKGENKHKEEDKSRESVKEHADMLNIRPLYPPKDSEKAGTEGNLKKRKHFETNGFVHENEMRPNKFPRPASSSYVSMENGSKLESRQIAMQSTSDSQVVTDSRKVEIKKEHKVNGIIEAQPPLVNARPSFALNASENGEASTRLPPHPDSKYLSQILTVPKMGEWSDFDDQAWLFSHNNLCSKPKVSVEVGETPQVWAEALRIDSADVCALPYVIPY